MSISKKEIHKFLEWTAKLTESFEYSKHEDGRYYLSDKNLDCMANDEIFLPEYKTKLDAFIFQALNGLRKQTWVEENNNNILIYKNHNPIEIRFIKATSKTEAYMDSLWAAYKYRNEK